MSSELARQKAAQAWCTPTTEKIVMQPELVEAFADILDEIWNLPWLGNATTRELIAEITTRIEMDDKLEYRTVKKEERVIDKLLEFGDKTSVLPMYISKSELEPSTEVILCSAISGGHKYLDGMPRELTLIRKLLSGKEYQARYLMAGKMIRDAKS